MCALLLSASMANAFNPHSSAFFKFFSERAAVVAERYSILLETHPVTVNMAKLKSINIVLLRLMVIIDPIEYN